MKNILVFMLCVMLNVAVSAQPQCRCLPGQDCWPAEHDWQLLAKQLTGRLVKPQAPTHICQQHPNSNACKEVLHAMHNPFYMQSKPGNTESQGWLDAWHSQPSNYAIEAAAAADVVAGVNFARQHHLRLVIKGAGHDYLGRSSAPDSLLIWTHHLDHLHYDQQFIPEGCAATSKPVQAVTVEGGVRWIQAYTLVTTHHHRYVQGGGCTTVGAAGGFIQGGGFGSWSKNFGEAAAGVLQAKIVTADGQLRTVNRCQNPDLFWALKGGGGGTFGVVTQMTLKTHPLPKTFGLVQGTLTAANAKAYQQLIKKFLVFYREHLLNKHWGEMIHFKSNNRIDIALVYQGLSKATVEKLWRVWHADIQVIAFPPDKTWDLAYWRRHKAEMVIPNTGENSRPGQYWWAGDGSQVSTYWYTYQSWWLPMKLFDHKHINQTAQLFYRATRYHDFALHIQKGLAGGSEQALAGEADTSLNPSAYHAATLVLMAAGTNKYFANLKGSQLDKQQAAAQVKAINKAMDLFKAAAPHAGSYANEGDYFQKNWQQVFWGTNYSRLLSIKQKYDPGGLFYCHHCVGSEYWHSGGMCPISTSQ